MCFKGENLDEHAGCFMALGAAGVAEEEAGILRCYIENGGSELEQIYQYANAHALTLVRDEVVTEQNWVALNPEIWAEITVGRLKIIPLASAETAKHLSALEIAVIPGEGFGTGHHPSTRQAVQLLQTDELSNLKPKSVVDVGTGSAILAIAATKLFDANVDAYEIDQRALVNAAENIGLNNISDKIKLHHGVFNQVDHAQLILANIYAEVLIEHEDRFQKTLNSGGLLIMAGIMESKFEDLKACFPSTRWRHREELREDGWCALLCERV